MNFIGTKNFARQFLCLMIKILLHFLFIFLREFGSGDRTKSLKASGRATYFAGNNEGFDHTHLLFFMVFPNHTLTIFGRNR